ncbi:MAG: acyl-CoA dehydrogenase family protein [Candidatus Binatia bacterium]
MDFSFSDEQQQIADLAKQIFTDKAPHERVRQIERAGGARFDRELWAEIAKAGLLGIAVPQAHDGAGLGFLEAILIVEQTARAAAPVPFLETVVLGALPIAEFGTAAQQQKWLPKIVAGQAIVTAALMEDQGDLGRPTTTAKKDGGGFRLAGKKICVPAAQIADLVLIPATVDGTIAVFLVETSTPGVRITALETTSGQPEAAIDLDDVKVGADALLGDTNGAQVLTWINERATTALAAVALGVTEQALALTAEYTKNRKQFDQPIAMFQAVGQRLADAYIDVEAIRLTTWQAAWRLAAGMPAAPHVAIAKFWADSAGQRVVHTAQHLHAGVGVDRDYPLHRYFLYAKQLELTLGGTTTQLRNLGKLIVAEADARA